jgi:hypothetical protein
MPVQWYQIKSGRTIAVVAPVSSAGQSDTVYKQSVYWITADGAIEDHFAVDLQTGSSAPDNATQAYQLALALPVPAILFAIGLLLVLANDPPQSYPAAVTAMLKDSWPTLMIAVLALAIVMAILVQRRSRAFGHSRREQIAWSVFVLLFGLPAYVGFRLIRRWPTRQPCPNCHAQAPRDRVACAECGMRFPDPALKGIEIFA